MNVACDHQRRNSNSSVPSKFDLGSGRPINESDSFEGWRPFSGSIHRLSAPEGQTLHRTDRRVGAGSVLHWFRVKAALLEFVLAFDVDLFAGGNVPKRAYKLSIGYCAEATRCSSLELELIDGDCR